MNLRVCLRVVFVIALAVCLARPAEAGGVGVVDAARGEYLRLTESHVRASVENQVALVTATQVFRNDLGRTVDVKYAFPMPEGASATALRWQAGGPWYRAVFTAAPQDTTLPGTGGYVDLRLLEHLGAAPLYFPIDEPIPPGGVLTVELTYVQLLPYADGRVDFTFPNDYSLIQAAPLDEQSLTFTLTSQRGIDAVNLFSHTPDVVTNDGAEAYVARTRLEAAADRDYEVRYELSPDELGLFGFSTLLPDSAVVDGGARGFFVFVAEPDPREGSDVIDKVFTLVVDRSGSMYGDKIAQARSAARFIVEHLNQGDRFNIVDFSSEVASFRPGQVPYTPATRDAALAYIDGFQANGLTNISGAFDVAVPQFAAAGDTTANLIVFFTDGRPTAGIQDADGILEHVETLVRQHENEVTVFTFGVGPDVDRPLLTRLATQQNGLSAFLDDEELEARITDFYLKIRSPVLLDTRIAFAPNVVTSRYPDPLPSLYKGQQMIVAGRYDEAAPLAVTLSGTAFGRPVSYEYELSLSDSVAHAYLFLPKVWAKLKIENLLVRYHSLPEGSAEANAVREEIVALSVAYGVGSPFTSLETGGVDPGGPGVGVEEGPEVEDAPEVPARAAVELLGASPNPFDVRTTLHFRVADARYGPVAIRIYDTLGRLVRVLAVHLDGPGVYEVEWDGRTDAGAPAPSGTYVYVLSLDDLVLAGTVVRVR